MSGRVTAAALWVTGVLGYLLLEALAAAAYPNYSYAHNYISDLGVTGPRVQWMHAAFCLQGTMFLAGAVFMVGAPRRGRTRLFLALVAANAIGNIVVGTVHSGTVHVAGAALALVGGNAAILAGSAVLGPTFRRYPSISKVIAAVGLLCLSMVVLKVQLLPVGVWERGSAYSIFLWQLMTATVLLRKRGHPAVTDR